MSAMLDSLAGQSRRATCAQHSRSVLAKFNSRVAGIPCQIEVTHYLRIKGGGCRWLADSPEDYFGFTECDFAIMDRSGRPAAWLEKKLTDSDRGRIETEVIEHMEAE